MNQQDARQKKSQTLDYDDYKIQVDVWPVRGSDQWTAEVHWISYDDSGMTDTVKHIAKEFKTTEEALEAGFQLGRELVDNDQV